MLKVFIFSQIIETEISEIAQNVQGFTSIYSHQNITELFEECQSQGSGPEIFMCAYCGLENIDFKDFVLAFCQAGYSPDELCTADSYFMYNSDELDVQSSHTVNWTTGKY